VAVGATAQSAGRQTVGSPERDALTKRKHRRAAFAKAPAISYGDSAAPPTGAGCVAISRKRKSTTRAIYTRAGSPRLHFESVANGVSRSYSDEVLRSVDYATPSCRRIGPGRVLPLQLGTAQHRRSPHHGGS